VKAVKSNGSADAGHVLARAMLGHKPVGLLSGRNKLLEPGRQTIDRLFADEGAYLKVIRADLAGLHVEQLATFLCIPPACIAVRAGLHGHGVGVSAIIRQTV
jgi:hypothetical protein